MKKFKKLIPAFCAMLVSAAMLGTSTYAWFSVNKKVEATGMQVTATSATTFFVIANDFSALGSASADATATDKSLPVTAATNSQVTPVAYTTTDISGTEITANSWYTAHSDNYNEALGTEDNGVIDHETVTFGQDGYFVKYTFYVGLAKDSSNWSGTLKVTVAKESGDDAVKAAVKVSGTTTAGAKDETQVTYTTLTAGWSTTNSYNFVAAKKTEGSVTGNAATYATVEVYVYIDGTSANVKSAQSSVTGSLKVSVEGVNA